MNDSLKFKSEYYTLAKNAIDSITTDYNAIHVRYPWFFPNPNTPPAYRNSVNIRDNPNRLLEQVKLLYDTDKPLYICTDIHKAGPRHDPPHYVNLDDYLNPIREHYKVIILEDLNLTLTNTEEIAVEQIICTEANKFYGTYYSTFSKRINIFRGIAGKSQVADYMGYDLIQDNSMEVDSPYPWTILRTGWDWCMSSYVQYTYED